MKNENVYREIFIENTIKLVAEGGFEMATTRAICGERRKISDVNLNEAHIYRVFGTKENLFIEVFHTLDKELISSIKEFVFEFDETEDFRKQCEILFQNSWNLLMKNEDKFKYYARFYHSVYFKKDVCREHKRKYATLTEKISPLFVVGADVWSLLHHIMTTLLAFATRVYNESLENSEENRTHIFNVVYSSIAPYLK